MKRGNRDGALAWIERAADWGYPDSDVTAWQPDLESLREEARFQAALGRMRQAGADRAALAPNADLSALVSAPVSRTVHSQPAKR